jgi:hypothetical protein
MNKQTEFDEQRCKELESEFAEFFEYLNSVDDLEKQSIEQLLDTAINEEEKFLTWKNSRRRLENVRLFHQTGGKRAPIKKAAKLSDFSRSIEVSVDVYLSEISEKSYFEIWECDARDVPQFSLNRISISKVFEHGKLNVRERLRDDVRLQIEAEMKENVISFKLSHKVSFHASAANSLKAFVENKRQVVRQTLQFGWLKEVFALANFAYVLLFLFVFIIKPATAMSPGVVYSEEMILKEECEKRVCIAR